MSRTPLFAAIQKALARSARDAGIILPQSSALTRRRLLRLSAAAAGATALSPVFKWSAHAKEEALRSIAIIGGGVAGLTASAGIAGWIEMLLLRRTLNARIGRTSLPASFASA